jgi:transcriptional regulator with XRE-family HTH domain
MANKTWKAKLGEQIRAARELRGISQEKLATQVHRKGRASIGSYENGEGNPEFEVIARIAAKLKADFSILGCRIVASELLAPPKLGDQLELKFDQEHSVLAEVIIKPTRKSLTITAHADYGIKSA